MSEHEMNVDMGGGRQSRLRVDYPSNSRRSKEQPPQQEKKRPEKVATGVVVQRRKSWYERVLHTVFSDETDTLSSYIVMEVLVPAFRNLLYDTVSQGAERALYGQSRRSSGSRTGYTNYSAASSRNPSRPDLSRQARASHDFDDIVLATRPEADEVLDALREMIELYGQATVADLYDLVGVSTDFTDNAWGWIDLRTASVRPIRGGYLLNLPRTKTLG